jgi:sialate O-acetylesterase
MKTAFRIHCFFLFLLCSGNLFAQVNSAIELPTIFCDSMIVQREQPIKIWGSCSPNSEVSVSFAGNETVVMSDGLGAFTTELPPMRASREGSDMKIKNGKDNVVISNILVGDVYFASGQSNMAFRLQSCSKEDVAEAKSDADYPYIRHFEVAKMVSGGKLLNASDKPWQTANSGSIPSWSAVAFYAARDLYKNSKIPVGIINCSQGAAAAEAFIEDSFYKKRLNQEEVNPKIYTDINSHYKNPSVLYNTMVSKVAGYPIRAIWWYQGEANAAMAEYYDKVLTTLIESFRENWNDTNLPFMIVQLPGFKKTNRDWVLTRQKQLEVSQNILNTGLVVTIDVGEEDDIHPKNKKVVGKRLALVTRKDVFKENVAYSPMPLNALMDNGMVVVDFDSKSSLKFQNKNCVAVEIAGQDSVFHVADITVKGKTLKAWSKQVEKPKYIRYAWENFPSVNLYEKSKMPATPFLLSVEE